MSDAKPLSLQRLLQLVNDNFVAILIAAVVFGGGFYVGSIWTENKMLKSGTAGTGAAAPVADPNAPTGPTAEQLAQMPEVSDEDWVRGNKDAKITLVEYSDLECPFCQRFHPTMNQVMEEYGDSVNWVFRHYPLPFHTYAQKAAEAAECAGKSGGNEAFWKFIDLYYEKTLANGTGYPQEDLASLAAEAGATQADVQKCLDDGEMTEKVTAQMAAGSTAGVSGTPGTIIVTEDGPQEIIPGALPIEQVKPMIEKYL